MIDSYGSFVTKGKRYSVLQCRGPVRHRQAIASQLGVICYAEGHLNAFPNPMVQYGFVVTPQNVPKATEQWAEDYLTRVGEALSISTKGIIRGVSGQGNVMHVKWPTPSMLLEPAFISEPAMGVTLSTGEGQDALGRALAESILETFPLGGLVGLSIGHAYRGNGDTGAPVADDPNDYYLLDPAFDTEAELVECYINSATELLAGYQ